MHTHRLISIFPSLGVWGAASSPFCFPVPSRELLLQPSNEGGGGKQEKESEKEEKGREKPLLTKRQAPSGHQKENAAVWTWALG